MKDVDGVCEDAGLLVLLLPRQVDPVVSVPRDEDEGEDGDDHEEEDGGEILADLGDGVGETSEVWV